MRIIGIIIIIGMVAGAIVSIDHTRFLDLPSLLIVVGGALGYVLAKGKSKHFIKNFGDGSVYMVYMIFQFFLQSGEYNFFTKRIKNIAQEKI